MKFRFAICLLFLFTGLYLIAQSASKKPVSSLSQPEEIPEIHGFDLSAMDRSIASCDDFYRFVCGNWLKNNSIPADQGRWGRFNQLAERNRLIAKQILEKASANDPKRDAVHQKIGDYYQACMDENAVNQEGLKPLQPELNHIDAIP